MTDHEIAKALLEAALQRAVPKPRARCYAPVLSLLRCEPPLLRRCSAPAMTTGLCSIHSQHGPDIAVPWEDPDKVETLKEVLFLGWRDANGEQI